MCHSWDGCDAPFECSSCHAYLDSHSHTDIELGKLETRQGFVSGIRHDALHCFAALSVQAALIVLMDFAR